MPEITLPQGTIRYREDGTGPVLVFVHGLLVDGRLWDPLVQRLSGRFRCVVPDWPLGSHELPMREDADLSPVGAAAMIAAFLEALGLEDVTLVGNDSGGALTQLVAVRHPERLARIVLTDCDAFENFPPKAFRPLAATAKVPGLLKAALTPMRLPAARRTPLAYGWLTKRPVPDELLGDWALRAVRDPGVMRDLRKFAGGLDPKVLLDNAARLGEFRKPALIAWSTEDRFFPIADARRLAAVLPGAQLETTGDAYSFLCWDQPGWLADRITAFAEAAAPVAEPAAVR